MMYDSFASGMTVADSGLPGMSGMQMTQYPPSSSFLQPAIQFPVNPKNQPGQKTGDNQAGLYSGSLGSNPLATVGNNHQSTSLNNGPVPGAGSSQVANPSTGAVVSNPQNTVTGSAVLPGAPNQPLNTVPGGGIATQPLVPVPGAGTSHHTASGSGAGVTQPLNTATGAGITTQPPTSGAVPVASNPQAQNPSQGTQGMSGPPVKITPSSNQTASKPTNGSSLVPQKTPLLSSTYRLKVGYALMATLVFSIIL